MSYREESEVDFAYEGELLFDDAFSALDLSDNEAQEDDVASDNESNVSF